MANEITQSSLQDMLRYDPETGIFTWEVRASKRIRVGDIAGTTTSHGYTAIKIKGKVYKAHRLAWLYMCGVWPVKIDHINHIRDDNRWVNINNATIQDNSRNISLSKNNTSGHTGITWHEPNKKWRARIMINGKYKALGLYKNIKEAVAARAAANVEFGFHPNHGKGVTK